MKFKSFFKSVKIWVADLTVGGSWGRTLSAAQQHNLHWFWFDGLFASASDNVIANFVSIFIIALGASQAQIGLMSSFSSIACALMLIPGAFLAERTLRKKTSALIFYTIARLSILLLVFVPIFFKGPSVIWIAIAFAVMRDAFVYLAYPAWMDVTNAIVPLEGRGRYFGSRNFVMSAAGMVATLLAGKLITVFVHSTGYQVVLAAAFFLGMASTFSYSRIHEDVFPQQPVDRGFSFHGLKEMFKGQPQFVALTLTAAIWNFALNVSGPFFNVQMVNVLKFDAATIGALSVICSLTSLLTQNQIGALADRVGPRRLQLISMFLIPLLPLAWIFAKNGWQIAIINTFNGVFWGLYNLAYFNLLLATIPPNQIPRYSAVYQIVVMLSLALGSLVGSAVVPILGFAGVCLISTAVRYVSAVLFAKIVHEPKKAWVEE